MTIYVINDIAISFIHMILLLDVYGSCDYLASSCLYSPLFFHSYLPMVEQHDIKPEWRCWIHECRPARRYTGRWEIGHCEMCPQGYEKTLVQRMAWNPIKKFRPLKDHVSKIYDSVSHA